MTISLECPPPPGSLELRFPLQPVSLQAKREAKAELQAQVRDQIRNAKYFLSGEVEVAIEWLLHPKIRYEGVHSPDIDNILKPLIDALSGPSGILVNDCQVQSVRCSWIDWMKEDHELHVKLRYSPDDWIRKDGLAWVEIRDKLCMPFSETLKAEQKVVLLEGMMNLFDSRAKLVKETGQWEAGQYLAPIQMPFHRARLRGFKILSGQKLLKELKDAS